MDTSPQHSHQPRVQPLICMNACAFKFVTLVAKRSHNVDSFEALADVVVLGCCRQCSNVVAVSNFRTCLRRTLPS
jgi:hypothetical protein